MVLRGLLYFISWFNLSNLGFTWLNLIAKTFHWKLNVDISEFPVQVLAIVLGLTWFNSDYFLVNLLIPMSFFLGYLILGLLSPKAKSSFKLSLRAVYAQH